MCRWKFSLSCMRTPKSFTDDEVFIFLWSTLMYSVVWSCFFLSMTMLLNFPGLTIISFDWNREIAVLLSDFRINFKFLICYWNTLRELSSAKLSTLTLSMKYKKPLKKQLNNVRPIMDPWGTLEITFWNVLCTLLMRMRCFLFER